jgi:hypothetical protein
MSESTRAYIYRIALAVLGLAVLYGVIAGEEAVAAWTALVTAVLGNGLAAKNTSTGG